MRRHGPTKKRKRNKRYKQITAISRGNVQQGGGQRGRKELNNRKAYHELISQAAPRRSRPAWMGRAARRVTLRWMYMKIPGGSARAAVACAAAGHHRAPPCVLLPFTLRGARDQCTLICLPRPLRLPESHTLTHHWNPSVLQPSARTRSPTIPSSCGSAKSAHLPRGRETLALTLRERRERSP